MSRSIGGVCGILVAVALAVALAGPGQARRPAKASTRRCTCAPTPASRSPCGGSAGRAGRSCCTRGLYRSLVIPPRSWRPLRIVGMRGVRVQNVLFYETQRVSFGRRPDRADQRRRARRGARLAPHRAARPRRDGEGHAVLRPRCSSRTRATSTIRRSNFMHCGDRARDFMNCVTLWRWSHRRADRGQRLPRLPRLRLRPRALRHRSDDPRQPLRPVAAVLDGPLPLRPPGSRPAVRRPPAARHAATTSASTARAARSSI